MSAKRATIGLGLLVVGLAACQSQDPCAPTGTPCGGDPTGVWSVVNGCREPVYVPPLPITYQEMQPVTMARQPPPEPTSSDWCSNLVYNANTGRIDNFALPFDTLFTSTGTVRYDANGAYTISLTEPGVGHVDLSATCLQRFGAVPSCDDVATKLATAGMTGSIYNIVCSDDGDNGCLCSYGLTAEVASGGSWSTDGTVLTHFDPTGFSLPTQADYCAATGAGTLTLWGHDQTDLWNQPGLRRIDLQLR